MALNPGRSGFGASPKAGLISAAPLSTRIRQGAVFLDKDGTLIEDVPYNVDPAQIRLSPGADIGLRLLGRLGLPLIVVSNQAGIGLGKFPARALEAVHDRLCELFSQCAAVLGGFYWCPHAPSADGRVSCLCRKPMPGLLQRAAAEHRIRMAGSWMVGDILDDIEAGRRAGCRTILIANGNETQWEPGPHRSPHYLVHGFDDAARVIATSVRSLSGVPPKVQP